VKTSANVKQLYSDCKNCVIAASKLGIKEYVPAYLGTNLTAYDLLTGVSFASGGAGYDPLTAELVVVYMKF
jgi:hypothetical protein